MLSTVISTLSLRDSAQGHALSSNGHIYTDIAEAEIRLQKSFLADCALQLQVLENAMFLLGELMASIEPPDPPLNPGEVGMPMPGDDQLVLRAHTMIAARGLRVIQAARPVLAAGYELEALVHNRIIIELVEHRRAIRDDEKPLEAARKWLKTPPGRIGPRIKKLAKGDLYELESRAAHGDPRLLAPIFNHDRNAIPLAPARSDLTRRSLVLYASFLVDQIEIISTLANVTSARFPPLRKALEAEWKKVNPS